MVRTILKSMLPAPVSDRDQFIGWPAWWALVGWAAAVLIAGIAGLIAVAAGASDGGPEATFAAQAGLWCGFLATAILASRVYGGGRLVEDFGLKVSAATAARSLFIGVATQVVVVPIVYLPVSVAGFELDVSGPAEELLSDLTTLERIVVVTSVVVLAPLTEELLFRGVMLGGLQSAMSPRVAAGVSALIFAALHFQTVQLPGLIAVGIVLAWLAIRTNGTGASVWAHVGFNATTVIALW